MTTQANGTVTVSQDAIDYHREMHTPGDHDEETPRIDADGLSAPETTTDPLEALKASERAILAEIEAIPAKVEAEERAIRQAKKDCEAQVKVHKGAIESLNARSKELLKAINRQRRSPRKKAPTT